MSTEKTVGEAKSTSTFTILLSHFLQKHLFLSSFHPVNVITVLLLLNQQCKSDKRLLLMIAYTVTKQY